MRVALKKQEAPPGEVEAPLFKDEGYGERGEPLKGVTSSYSNRFAKRGIRRFALSFDPNLALTKGKREETESASKAAKLNSKPDILFLTPCSCSFSRIDSPPF